MSTEKPGIKKLYYSIGEVSESTGLKPYVLRYWETEFKQLNPPKNRAGNRTYRKKDIDTILRIKELLYDKKFTIEGARKQLVNDQQQSRSVGSKKRLEALTVPDEPKNEIFNKIKQELQSILEIIND